MAEGAAALTEKEKETLRLIVRGHDAKSMARHLGLSVHTVNERLRLARRKMAVSSSREAARLLLDAESGPPDFLADNRLGDALVDAGRPGLILPERNRVAGRVLAWTIGGTIMLSLLLAALLLPSAEQSTGANPAAPPPPAVTPVQTAAAEAAQRWLELVDAGDWRGSWLATARSFQDLNTLQAWTAASEKARTPLGAVQSRSVLSYDSVPAPPSGYEIVKFRTSFAHRPDAIEIVSLAPEGDEWRVAGIYIE